MKSTLITSALVILAISAQAQQLTLHGRVVDDPKQAKGTSVVNLYRYASSVQESVLVDHRTIKHNVSFKFDLALEHGYVMEVVSSNGSYKRVIVNTETLTTYDKVNCQFEVEVDVRHGAKWGRDPEDVAWVFYNPAMGSFAFSEVEPSIALARQ